LSSSDTRNTLRPENLWDIAVESIPISAPTLLMLVLVSRIRFRMEETRTSYEFNIMFWSIPFIIIKYLTILSSYDIIDAANKVSQIHISQEGFFLPDYYIRAVCLNGHILSNSLSDPNDHDAYCDLCGAQVITACPSCGAFIKGRQIDTHVRGAKPAVRNNCYACGEPYPWISRAIVSLAGRLEADGYQEEAEAFQEILPDIVAESPSTNTALIRFSGIMKRVGGELAVELVKFGLNFGCQSLVELLRSNQIP